jgi:hypothetical protein
MAQLMFRCPYTNRPIAAGFDLHVPSLRTVSDYPISVLCPHCGLRHYGTIADGCLADDSIFVADEAPPGQPRVPVAPPGLKKR